MRFRVLGKAVGKQRPRFNSRSKQTYTPSKTKDFEKLIANTCTIHMLKNRIETSNKPCKVVIDVMASIPKSYTKKRHRECIEGIELPAKKPDIDNIAKAVMDGLNKVAYEDDTQVVTLTINKRYWEHNDALYIEVSEVI